MSEQDLNDENEMAEDEAMDIALDLRTQIFLAMRQQNLELLQIATQVAGYGKEHGPLKPEDARKALRSIWEVYSEFYSWVDPEESEEDEEGDDE